MKQNQLELTFVQFCNEKAETLERKKRAKDYIQTKESKLEKAIDKILPFAVTMAVISSIISLCIVEYVHYDVFGTLL